jgi:hypothetical protein
MTTSGSAFAQPRFLRTSGVDSALNRLLKRRMDGKKVSLV